jgi:catechol 2,3-dioxygenase-like lactoylglutathione lyase family enzyme
VSLNVLLPPSGLDRSRRFYRDVLGLAICREFRAADDPGVVFSWARACSRSPGTRRALQGIR